MQQQAANGPDMGFDPGFPAAYQPKIQVLHEGIDTSSETGRVPFLGKLPYAQYRRVLQVSAVHVYLAYPFVLSWSLLEALASGCAVVASDTAPVREVIRHGENGRLVEFFDGARLVDAVVKVLTDQTGMQAMRRAALESVKKRFAQAAGTAGYLALLGCDFPMARGLNLQSEFLQEAQ